MATVREFMTGDPICMEASCSAMDAARAMRDKGIGDVLVTRNGQVVGICTDRDIVVRVLAEGREPDEVQLEEICSKDLATVRENDDVKRAQDLMRDRAVRRIPVTDDEQHPVGIVSLGDLAAEKDRHSVLGEISSAPPNN